MQNPFRFWKLQKQSRNKSMHALAMLPGLTNNSKHEQHQIDNAQNWRAIVILLTDRSLSSGANNVSNHSVCIHTESLRPIEPILPIIAKAPKNVQQFNLHHREAVMGEHSIPTHHTVNCCNQHTQSRTSMDTSTSKLNDYLQSTISRERE